MAVGEKYRRFLEESRRKDARIFGLESLVNSLVDKIDRLEEEKTLIYAT